MKLLVPLLSTLALVTALACAQNVPTQKRIITAKKRAALLAKPALAKPQKWVLTVTSEQGTVTLPLPPNFLNKSTEVKVNSDNVLYYPPHSGKSVANGNAKFQYGPEARSLEFRADHIEMQTSNSPFHTVVLTGRASVRVHQAGKTVMQFNTDNATISPIPVS